MDNIWKETDRAHINCSMCKKTTSSKEGHDLSIGFYRDHDRRDEQ